MARLLPASSHTALASSQARAPVTSLKHFLRLSSTCHRCQVVSETWTKSPYREPLRTGRSRVEQAEQLPLLSEVVDAESKGCSLLLEVLINLIFQLKPTLLVSTYLGIGNLRTDVILTCVLLFGISWLCWALNHLYLLKLSSQCNGACPLSDLFDKSV